MVVFGLYRWLTGRDGNVWVWVMGEHPDDKSIEQILDQESKEKARRLAENEVFFSSKSGHLEGEFSF